MSEFKLSYTANQINERLSRIDSLAGKSELPTKTSDLINDSNFTTKDYIQDFAQPKGDYALKSEIPEVDLSNYALKNEIPTDYLTEIPEEYVTEVELEAKGYLTEHQSLDGLATENYVNAHNTAIDAHNDIRLLIENLTTHLNTLADSDDTTLDQMSEIVAYIKSNKNLIDSITTSKVNVSDIIDNLTTNVNNKPLSAAQGVALKMLIDAIVIPTKLSELTNDSGFITGYTETDPTVPAWAKEANKPTYTASEVGALPADTVIPSIEGLATESYVDNKVASKQDAITGTAGQFVVIGANGKPTTETILIAEEETF